MSWARSGQRSAPAEGGRARLSGRWKWTWIAIAGLVFLTVARVATNPPGQVTASQRGVKATLTTKPNPVRGRQPIPTGLTIIDHGALAYNAVPCHGCELDPPAPGSPALGVWDLAATGRPQVLLFLHDGGGSHFATLAIYDPTATGTYRMTLLRSFYVRAYTTDVGLRQGPSGPPVLVTDDPRYLQFVAGGGAFAQLPLVVWRYADGQLTDVSARYPLLLRREAARALKNATAFARARAAGTGQANPDPRGALATYAADEARLGQRPAAEQVLRTALADGWLNEPDGPHGAGFISALDRLLGTADVNPAAT
jgi:hypothetical protein